MDELTMLRQFGDGLDAGTSGPLPATRQRVLAVAAGGDGHRGRRAGGSSGRSRWSRWTRSSRWAVPAGGALLAGGLVITVGLIVPEHQPGTQQPGAGQSAQRDLDVMSFLGAAARKARAGSDHAPSPQAFLYMRTLSTGTHENDDAEGGPPARLVPYEGEREAWQSMDGSRDGVIAVKKSGTGYPLIHDNRLIELPACPKAVDEGCGTPVANESGDGLIGLSGCPRLDKDAGRCTPAPSYWPDAPTDPVAARAFLYRDVVTGTRLDDDRAMKQALDLLVSSHLRPASLAAVLQAMGGIPGVGVSPDTVTLAGRSGIAVGRTNTDRWRFEVIFDEEYSVVGYRHVYTAAAHGEPPGSWRTTAVILERAIVDGPLVRPDGTEVNGRIVRTDR